MEAIQGKPVEERMHAAGSRVEGAWKAVMDWYMPSGDAEGDHLEKELNNISMDGDEDPTLCFARAEGKLNVLPTLGIHKSDSEVVRLVTRRLPSESYDVEQQTSLLRPGIKRLETDYIASPMLTARPRRWRSRILRRLRRGLQRRWTRMLSPLQVAFRATVGAGVWWHRAAAAAAVAAEV